MKGVNLSLTLGRKIGAGQTGGKTGAGQSNPPTDMDMEDNCRPKQNVKMGKNQRARSALKK